MRTTIIERCEKMLCNLDEYQQKGKFELFIDGGDLMDLEEDILLTSGKKAMLYPLYEFLDGVNNLYEQTSFGFYDKVWRDEQIKSVKLVLENLKYKWLIADNTSDVWFDNQARRLAMYIEHQDWHNAYEEAQAIAQRDCFFMGSADWADTLTGLEYPETLTDEGKQYLRNFGNWLYSQVKQLRRKYEQPSVGGME